MNDERINIGLNASHRGQGSSMFTGRPQGNQVREKLGIDKKDSEQSKFLVEIPLKTTSFNPSFFLGLFFPSVKKLGGYDNFAEKYKIVILSKNDFIKESLELDLKDCERQARNEFSKKTGLSIF